MSFNVIITSPAHNDVLNSYVYYEEQQPGLGNKFLEELSKKYDDLALHPNNYGFIDEDPLKVLRDVRLKKFPYAIVFEIIKTDVIIYAVHHLKRHPKSKLRKN